MLFCKEADVTVYALQVFRSMPTVSHTDYFISSVATTFHTLFLLLRPLECSSAEKGYRTFLGGGGHLNYFVSSSLLPNKDI